MSSIKFSHTYPKMPTVNGFTPVKYSRLMEVFVTTSEELSDIFVIYDTAYKKDDGTTGRYELPKGKVLVLLLAYGNWLWTTVRRWTPEKEQYYRSLRGKIVGIEINEEDEEHD